MSNFISDIEVFGVPRAKVAPYIRSNVPRPSLVTQQSRVVAGAGTAVNNGAGNWRENGTVGETLKAGSIDSTFTRVPGRPVLKIDATSTSGSFQKKYRRAFASPVAVTGAFELWHNLPVPSAGGHTLTVRFSSDVPANDPPQASPTNYVEMVFIPDRLNPGYWFPAFWHPAGKLFANSAANGVSPTTVGTVDLNNIRQAEVQWDIPSAVPSSERVLYIDMVAVNGKAKPHIIFGVDGFDYASNTSFLLPEFNKYGLNFYLAGDGNRVTPNKAALDAIYAAGNDIVMQGMDHVDYTANVGRLAADIDAATAIFINAGYTRALDCFAYPYNNRNLATDAILRSKGFKIARSIGGFRIPSTSLGRPDLLDVGALDMGQKTSAQIIAWIDDAILCGYHLFLYGHEWVTSASTSTQTNISVGQAVIAYLADKHFSGQCTVGGMTQFLLNDGVNWQS